MTTKPQKNRKKECGYKIENAGTISGKKIAWCSVHGHYIKPFKKPMKPPKEVIEELKEEFYKTFEVKGAIESNKFRKELRSRLQTLKKV